MAKIFPGRYTTQIETSFVVFLIGMRINRLLAVGRWVRVLSAMPPMIAELERNPSLGLLHSEFLVYWRGVAVLQYWKSFDDLHHYAHERNAKHLPAWAEFNRRIGNDGSVGIWHETYLVQPGHSESVYVNMHRFGLGGAVNHLPATGKLKSARSRMGMEEVPAEDAQSAR